MNSHSGSKDRPLLAKNGLRGKRATSEWETASGNVRDHFAPTDLFWRCQEWWNVVVRENVWGKYTLSSQ